MKKLSDFIVKEAIIPELKARDREGVVRELVEALAAAKAISPGDVEMVVKAVMDRERTGSTGLGKGVAVPHLKHNVIKKQVAALGRSSIGVDFSAFDGAPVYSVFLVLSPLNNPDAHLQAMERIVHGLLQVEMFPKFLRQSDTRKKIIDLIEETDQAGGSR